MASYEGDVLRPPGVSAPTVVEGSEELLYSTASLPLKKGGKVESGVGVLKTGEPIKFNTTTNSWVKATEEDAEALNYKATDATSEARLINVIFGATVNTKVSGLKELDLDALATQLGGKYDANYGFMRF